VIVAGDPLCSFDMLSGDVLLVPDVEAALEAAEGMTELSGFGRGSKHWL
jgi:hypothetical protein